MKYFNSIYMKPSLLLLLIAIVLIALAATQFFAHRTAVLAAHTTASPALVYDATAAMQKAIVQPWEVRASVSNTGYDATAAMQKSVVQSWEVKAAAMMKSVMQPSQVNAIPVTGIATGYNDPRMREFKERQAEQMSGGTR